MAKFKIGDVVRCVSSIRSPTENWEIRGHGFVPCREFKIVRTSTSDYVLGLGTRIILWDKDRNGVYSDFVEHIEIIKRIRKDYYS